MTNSDEEPKQARGGVRTKPSVGLSRGSNLHRADSVKDLIGKFSGPEHISYSSAPLRLYSGPRRVVKSVSMEALNLLKSKSSPSKLSVAGQVGGPVPSIVVTPFREAVQNGTEPAQNQATNSKITARIDCPVGASAQKAQSEPRPKPQTADSGKDSVADSGMGLVRTKKNNCLQTNHS